MTVLAQRRDLVTATKVDLAGSFHGSEVEELKLPPSRWYPTGFLAPEERREIDDPTADDENAAGDDDETEEAAGEDAQPKLPKLFPASIGVSVLLRADARRITIRASWAFYTRERTESQLKENCKTPKRDIWIRHPQGPFTVDVPLDAKALSKGIRISDTDGVYFQGKVEAADIPGLAKGTLALSIFLVNQRKSPEERGHADEAFLFQVEMELECSAGFVPRPDRSAEQSADIDDKIADLQYRKHCEYAVGHGVAVETPDDPRNTKDRVTLVRTTWIPRAEVPRVKPGHVDGVEIHMRPLAELGDADDVARKLAALPEKYSEWLETQANIGLDSAERRQTRDHLIKNARIARDRIRQGNALLQSDPEVRRAFCLANQAMADAALARSNNYNPSWRLFQLAFVLLNLPGIADPRDKHREHVELIFFPTGGGKTEAYLGLIAFTLLLRRMRARERPDEGLGVAVLLRYTLRLLTLDQLGRAASLVCALERLRQQHPQLLGDERFSVGLWVGRSATANTLHDVARKTTDFKNRKTNDSPFPLAQCPWCNTDIKPDSLTLWPKPTKPEEIRVACINPDCDFSGRKTKGEGLPILFVDEQIYRELPCFLVATVDKFAMLPWRGETGMLFGKVEARYGRHFYGPIDGKPPKGAVRLHDGNRPPELIVQDELHLISGPLGTMVGLYETAIDRLCTWTDDAGKSIRPKVVASTATVRRAQRQIQALFGRNVTHVFPPPAVDAFESWFATIDRDSPGRLYIGVAANGRALKAIMLRTYTALLGAAMKQYDPNGPPDQTADGYMTLVGYFNSLRELGGMRRLVEDDIRTRCDKAEERVPVGIEQHPWVKNRTLREPVELTSRESTAKIAASRARLSKPYADKESVDVLLASNMISVGIDIDRLGLMVVAGQPKTTSEYIQATSRVGRDPRWPGLVVTCFNVHKPRDRSHYERFAAYHASFYRYVEATSITPFSAPAIDRGLAGVLTALVRLGHSELTPPGGVMEMPKLRPEANAMSETIAKRAGDQPSDEEDGDIKEAEMDRLRARGQNLLDAWDRIVQRARKEGAGKRGYSPFEKPRVGRVLLRGALEAAEEAGDLDEDEQKFVAPTSMRDVEATVHLWVERRNLGRGR